MSVALRPASPSWLRPYCGERCSPRAHHLADHEMNAWHHGRAEAERERAALVAAQATVVTGPLTIDVKRTEVLLDGRVVFVTATELRLLFALARRPGETVTWRELLEAVWGAEYQGEIQLVRVNMSRLRSRLRRAGSLVVTVNGIGFRLEIVPPDAEIRARPRMAAGRLLDGAWSIAHDRCVDCGQTERPHKGQGRCRRCYDRLYESPAFRQVGRRPKE